MKPRAQKAIKGLRIGIRVIEFFGRVAENGRARRAGKPKPHTVRELFTGAVDIGEDIAEDIAEDFTPAERPSKKR